MSPRGVVEVETSEVGAGDLSEIVAINEYSNHKDSSTVGMIPDIVSP